MPARITSRQNAIVATFRALARGSRTSMLLDGPHLVAEALDADVTIERALVAAEWAAVPPIGDLVARLEAAHVDVAAASSSVMSAVSPVRSGSAIVAAAQRPAFSISRVFGGPAHDFTPLVVIACDVQDPGNLGAILRVAEAAGASGVIAAGASADPFGWKALRGSMGSALRLPVITRSAAEAMAEARRRHCSLVALVPRGGRPPEGTDMTGAVALLIGGEGAGLGQALVDGADERLTIPMRPPVESLNAAVSAGIVLYEAQRQRHGLAVL
jgi:RNA methyltransferase, TrmH family